MITDSYENEMEESSVEFGDQEYTDKSTDYGIPNEERKLQTQAYDKAVSDLVEGVRTKEIIIDPDYQRNYIWDDKRASLLVESIVMNVPIPVIYVAEDEDGKWVVVDGLQRLESLRRFFDNEFKLKGLEILDELSGEQYSNLNPKARRILRNGLLRVIVIKYESHPDIKYDIFQRLNRGSIRLNEQELRNCMYRGSFLTLLKELRENEQYLHSLGLKKPDKRFIDAELILRFFALSSSYSPEKGKIHNYTKMKNFLNHYAEKNQHLNDLVLREKRELFLTTVEKVVSVFPGPSFRRIINGGKEADKYRLNRALMDAIMLTFSRYDEDFITHNKESIIRININLTNDTEYCDALVMGTSDTKRIEYRLNVWEREFRNLS